MASNSHIGKTRYRLRLKKAGRKRKNDLARKGTTPSRAVFFGDTKR